MTHSLAHPFKAYRFTFLLATLLLLTLASPGLPYLQSLGHDILPRVIFSVVYLLMVLAGAAAASAHSRQFRVACILGGLLFLFQGASFVSNATPIILMDLVVSAVFMVYVQYLLMHYLLSGREVTFNVICASLCGYLLLAVLWASLYSIAEVLEPGSFAIANQPDHKEVRNAIGMDSSGLIQALYYSFITLTTLGYGDIAPTTPLTRMLAALEAVVGQIYLTVLIARLVGLHIAKATVSPEKN